MSDTRILANEGAGSAPAVSIRWRRLRLATLPFAAGVLTLFASITNFLTYNHYPLASPEVGLVALAAVTLALVAGLVYAFGGNTVRIVLELLLVYLAIDLNISDPLIAAASTLAAAIILNRHLMSVLVIVSAVVLVLQLAGTATGAYGSRQTAPVQTGDDVVAAATDRPAIVHLILDEHIGVEGISGEAPEGREMRQDLTSFYAGKGFRLFGRAHSEYLHTVNSIPHLLNFGEQQDWTGNAKDGVTVRRNAYFNQLEKRGYQVNVYQNNFVDYCAEFPHLHCSSVNATDLGPVHYSDLRVYEKSVMIFYGFASVSKSLVSLQALYNYLAIAFLPAEKRPPLLQPLLYSASAIGALDQLNDLRDDLREAKPGQAYFAHLLFPHYPYMTRPDCTLKPLAEWQYRSAIGQTLEARRSSYAEQLHCTMNKIEDLVATLNASVGESGYIMIVQGDHGARITQFDPRVDTLGRFSERDLVDSYSTLFAVKAPGIAAGYEGAPRSIADILSALAASDFRSTRPLDVWPHRGTVVLENADWAPVQRHPLPEGWAR